MIIFLSPVQDLKLKDELNECFGKIIKKELPNSEFTIVEIEIFDDKYVFKGVEIEFAEPEELYCWREIEIRNEGNLEQFF
ncbi:hypothetical protein [Methanosarcina horonobensis]|uniref:hypothetical protein n=1 Tax=Methanosarcina horonobensis TaxID=418008 RepID=UPI000AC0CE83|nr:hypothetical protein [Methanosarcina horonobensis]